MKKETSEVDEISIVLADESHLPYVKTILTTIEEAAKVRGTGIAKRSPEYIESKMKEGKAIIALTQEGEFAGFCYIETWGDKKFVANSGLIVVDTVRGHGLAKRIKKKAFQISRERYPDAKIFGLTAGLPVNLLGLVNANGKVWGLESFGFSAPYKVLDEKLGFTGKNVYEQVKAML